MECEDCRTYSPCISACPKKTCDNLHTYAQLAKGCEDLSGTCFEGCDLQPCPTGQVYASLDAGTCIPEPLCDTPSCKLNGKVYRDGERVADPAVCNNDCEICNCRNGTLQHISYAFCQSLTGPTQGPRMDPPLNPGAEPMRVPVLDRQQNQKTTAGVNICGPGLVWQACLYRCDEVCDYLARSTGACDGSAPGQCVSGCRNSTVPHTLCAPGEKRVDAETCAPANMCPCLKPDGTMARPFETWKNPDDACSDCSCYNGFSLCSATDPSCSASPDATPTAAPQATPTCGWSQWMNTNTPTSGSGDVESLASLRTQFGLCDSPLQIECRDTVTRQPVSSGPGVTCDVQTGLTCSHADSGATCPDYEVRVYCPCTDLLTPAPDSTPTVTPRGMCLTRWSDWVNKDTPADGRDFEKLTVEELSRFCPGGKITAVQCFTADDIEYFSSGETVTCSLQDGLVCNNADNAPLPCSDYKIKYQCTCAPVINNDEGPTLKPPQDPPKCGWTAWMNSHTPSDVGEQETLTQLRQQFHVCATEDMTALECRPAGGQQEDSQVRAASVCDMRYSGFLCRHDDLPAGHSCPDYEIRFLCEPRELDCTGPTASPDKVPTHPPRFPSLNPTAAPERNQGRNVPEPTMPAYPVCADDMTNLVPLEIDNSQLRASSSLSLYTTAARSRLRTQQEGVFTGGWAAGGSAGEEWLEVKFPHAVTVAGVVTQGRDGYPNWVTEYTLMYSLDGMQYHYYTEQEGVPKVFQGNSDSSTEVPHTIQPITARFFIIKPVSWFGAVAMRFAFIGCQAVQVPTAIPTSQPVARPTAMPVPDIPDICVVEMGMMTGDIRDDMISASSFRDAAHAPHKARLGGTGSWLAARDDVNQYIQIDLLAPHYVTGVTTQGRGAAPSWVKSYRVLYSMDGVNWNVYREASGVDKVFTANTDSSTPVTHLFQHPVRAQYVRISPLTWEGRIALRMELHGCFEPYPPGVAPGVPTAFPTAAPTVQPSSNIPDGCIKWDAWVDTHQPGLVSRDDSEPIARVLAESQTCADPLAIQCRTATIDHTPWELTGQPIRCNLWDGLVCNAADVSEPSCFNYEVRLGCLRQTAECLSHVPTGTPTSRPDAQPPVLPCYPGMDTTSCPLTCLLGQYCDGARCVSRAECPCVLEGRIVRARDVTTNGACETCQCLNGEIRCMAKTCTSCPQGVSMLNSVTCGCECVTCDVTQFQCDGGQCIPAASNCDGVIDCMNDELSCSNPAKFVPPSLRPTARPDATPSGSTTPAIQPVQRDTVTPPKEPRFEPTPRPPKRCPRHCPVPPQIVCPEDVDVVAVIGDCNCTTKACLATPLPVTTPRSPQPVCRYQHTGEAEQVYQIGDTWTDGACSECTCISGSGGAGEISCQKQRCADCKMGESRVDQPGQCCGLCEAVGCLQDGRVYKVGEEMPTWRACYKKTCEMDLQQTTFYIRETQVTCPRIHTLQLCHDDANRYDAQGCCLICVPKTLMNNSTESCVPCTPQPVFTSPHESIGHFQVTTTGGATCHNRDPVSDLTQCVGSCASQATYTDLIRSYSSTCSCCQPGATRGRTVQLSCDDGSTLTHTYQVATECACGTCTNKQ